ncbi:flagellar hook-associated protein FlgK [Halodesulfovibrio marinisediminis]|uniref:Flagellar hook-associated protein 1 n=1 Tax=Halodesulfovibrio marinisediminis DSM 17456 TaxID=1121457 RepID=A0A1N6GU00_9BACT|nr:flagellar hook-associated protein FlgK [Halodesulfovibrio marinisediminis]SIO10952.1 flagellar hook-associated protein 1 FlgK [Halodesulfovibrio marinisediminis DSM 17456]
MINAIYNTGLNGMVNSQASVNVTTNNIANADVAGYKKQTPIYQTSSSIQTHGLTVGTGAQIAGIEASMNYFVEQQYLATSSEAAKYNQQLSYQMQLESTLGQSDTTGLNAALSGFFSAWNTLAADPTQPGAWEEVFSTAQGIATTYNDTYAQMEKIYQSIDQEISAQVSEANVLIDEIAALNAQVAANPSDNQAVDARDQAIRELSTYTNITVEYQTDGTVTVLAEGRYALVEGQETHHLSHQPAQSRESLMPSSTYDGGVEFKGDSSEEIMIEFIDDTHYYASLDGGKTWITDESGNPVVYEAGDADDPENVAGVDIWFSTNSGTHATGDRYIITPKSGLYLEKGDGSYLNLTPMTDDQGVLAQDKATSGSIAGLFITRDDSIKPTMDAMDGLAEALIWETNVLHSKGAGLEHHTSLSGSYDVKDATVPLSESGLYFADRLEAGTVEYVLYNDDGSVASTVSIDVDPVTDSLDDIATKINTASGGDLTATVTAEGTLELASGSGLSFEVAQDDANLMAGVGLNTFFTGTSADAIAVNGYVANNPQHINAGSVNEDGSVVSGDNSIAFQLAALAEQDVSITVGTVTYTDSLSSFSSMIVSDVGADVMLAEQNQVYAQGSNEYYYDYQLSSSGVNVDEEQVNLIKYQQQYEACVKVITTARDMLDEVLDML